MKQLKGLSAWLVTWAWCGDHAKPQNKIVEILSPRISPEQVREIVELLYHREASISEKMSWRLRKQKQPYPAEFVRIEGVPWQGQISCGHNPWLLARLVDNLIIGTGAVGDETAEWTDRYSVHEATARIHRMHEASGLLS